MYILFKKLHSFFIEFLNTGERPMLNQYYEDIPSLYQFVYKFVGCRIKPCNFVLDYGCGGGYGTEYLSRYTKRKIIGFDINKSIIKINKNFFFTNTNIIFTSENKILEQYKGKFDVIISSQVVEHLPKSNVDFFIKNLTRSLKKNGHLYISTVNKNITSKGLKKPIMPFHEYEYYPEELKKILKNYFQKIIIYGQEPFVKDSKSNTTQKDIGLKVKIIRGISQYEIIRIIARHTPLFIKSILLGYKLNENNEKYKLTVKKVDVEKCYVLIYECKKKYR